MARATLTKKAEPEDRLRFIHSGGVLLDCILGGGWVEGGVANLVGDKSTGKTLLAIEACANFAADYPAQQIAYREREAAFDQTYARTMGMPDKVDWREDVATVEEFERDLGAWLSKQSGHQPSLYILDSLDSLSDEAELERDIGQGSYGGAKAKKMSELFRKNVALLRDKRCTLLVISQIRDKIGVTFGETKTRSGGHALDFYSSQIVWLSEIKKLSRVVSGVQRVTGVEIRAKNKKLKIRTGKPFREADFSILFGYGIDDEQSMMDWLKKNKGDKRFDMPLDECARELRKAREVEDRDAVMLLRSALRDAVAAHWAYIEEELAPPMRKYES